MPSKVTISFSRARAEPATTSSPGAIEPEMTVPAKPRKSPFGRLTHCTWKRNGRSLVSFEISTALRCPRRLGPSNHVIRADGSVTLSPNRAESGIACTDTPRNSAAKAKKPFAISSKRARSNPTRSILLTASTMWWMPSNEQVKACLLVCGTTPFRASTRSPRARRWTPSLPYSACTARGPACRQR